MRTYKRKDGSKRYADYTLNQLQKAAGDVKTGKLSVRESAVKYSVPRSTVSRKVRGVQCRTYGHQTIFSAKEETTIVHYLCTVADWGFPMSLFDARTVAKLYLDQAGRKVKAFKNNMPGIDGAHRFAKRHKNSLMSHLCRNIQVVQSQIDSDTVNKFFDNISMTLQGIDASSIVNYDETNLSDDSGGAKLLFKRGTRYPERI